MIQQNSSQQPALMSPGWHAARTPEAPAIIMGSDGATVTYGDLDERSRRFARALRSRDLKVGDHLAILMGNDRAFLEVAWAAQRAGLYYTAINSHLRPGEVQHVLDDSGASALVAGATQEDVVMGLDMSRTPVRVSVGRKFDGFECYDDVLAAESPARLDDECEGREMPPGPSTSSTTCPATPTASSTSGCCAIGTGSVATRA